MGIRYSLAKVLTILLICSTCWADEIDDLIPKIIAIESSGDPHAVSDKGCIGLMQISPLVVKELNDFNREGIHRATGIIILDGLTRNQLFDPEINKRVGTWYLRRLKDHYLKDKYTPERLLGAYSWGIGNVRKVNYEYKRFPKSVKKYVRKVMRLWTFTETE